jgi:outer membrane protein OmpA-like peptidoglycan-associated protein
MSVGSNLRMGRMLTALLAVFAGSIISNPVLAQSDSNPKYDVFAGYQWLNPGGTVPAPGDPNNPSPFKLPSMAKGIGGAFTFNFDKHWGLETDFGYNRDTNSASSEWTVSAGPRFIVRTDDNLSFFLHALPSFNRVTYNAGATTSNGIGALLGGGMDLSFAKGFAWRVFQVDYVWSPHNFADLAAPQFPDLRRPTFEGVRLRTGIVLTWGGAPLVTPAASCSVQPAEVIVGEPVTATVSASNFNPKHTLTYLWNPSNGGKVIGKDATAQINTTDAAPGNYMVTAHVTDPRASKNNQASCSANFTVKPLPPKNPPTVSISANPTSLQAGGPVSLAANCTSPDGVSVSVASWTASSGTVSGSGSAATLDTTGVPPGTITVGATCTDNRGLAGQASTAVTIENPPPPPPPDKQLEARLALHSVYFPTNLPPVTNPNSGLVASQEQTLIALATDFQKYLAAKPDAHLTLEGHADKRGSVAFNQALSERRVARVKSFLVEHGVPAANIETTALGDQHNLTEAEVKDSVDNNPDLSQEERTRILSRMQTIIWASNRRVDVTLNTGGQTETSVRRFPFNAADSLTLIGGREGEAKKKAAKPAPKKKITKKP